MDVDEDDDAAQQLKQVKDYGIEVDFGDQNDEDREVRIGLRGYQLVLTVIC